jgi:hypothetical protein
MVPWLARTAPAAEVWRHVGRMWLRGRVELRTATLELTPRLPADPTRALDHALKRGSVTLPGERVRWSGFEGFTP